MEKDEQRNLEKKHKNKHRTHISDNLSRKTCNRSKTSPTSVLYGLYSVFVVTIRHLGTFDLKIVQFKSPLFATQTSHSLSINMYAHFITIATFTLSQNQISVKLSNSTILNSYYEIMLYSEWLDLCCTNYFIRS